MCPGDKEIPFSDGNLGGAVRVGSTVRRSTGPWTPAVHQLLRHLESKGFDGAPRVLGLDYQAREILSYIGGHTDADPLVSFCSDESLTSVAILLRKFHDATVSFQGPHDAMWQFQKGAPRSGEVICHNDIAPWNTIVNLDQPTAFIDWDFAAPGPRNWDIAHALWRFVPLCNDPRYGSIQKQARRIQLFVDSYGLSDRSSLLETVLRRQKVLFDTVAAWASEGRAEFLALWNDGHAEMVMRDIQYLTRNLDHFARELERDN